MILHKISVTESECVIIRQMLLRFVIALQPRLNKRIIKTDVQKTHKTFVLSLRCLYLKDHFFGIIRAIIRFLFFSPLCLIKYLIFIYFLFIIIIFI